MFTQIWIFLALFATLGCSSSEEKAKFEQLKAQNSIAAFEQFIENSSTPELKKQAVRLRDSLVFDSIKQIDTRRAYLSFIEAYPESDCIAQARERLELVSGVRPVVSTFRGNGQRNFYGNSAPSRLDEIWKFNLGSGRSFAYGKMYVWSGAGWTGQPLVVLEDSGKFLVQGAFDYHLRKINAETGKEVWRYKFDDILKGTGTIWVNPHTDNPEEKYVIMQGSRRGEGVKAPHVTSFRGVSYMTGKELWRMNIKKTRCYSRDVDGSALTVGDTAYIGLENGIFTVFDPSVANLEEKDGMVQPKIYSETMLYNDADAASHGGNLVTESSPTYLNGKIYVASGSGHVYGYNIKTGKIDWDFFVGADMDGSPPVTDDQCILVTVEKEYIAGKGGVYKLNPAQPPEEAVEWFFPTKNKKYFTWHGGIIGSAAVNDYYVESDESPHIAAFTGIDGYLYVVDHQNLAPEKVPGTDGKTMYPTPKLLFKHYVGPSISSPIIVGNRIVAAGYSGIYLFEFDKNLNFKQLDHFKATFEASPIAFDGKIYIASNGTGYLYCLGEK